MTIKKKKKKRKGKASDKVKGKRKRKRNSEVHVSMTLATIFPHCSFNGPATLLLLFTEKGRTMP
ncbi:hypothetical protein OIU74_027879 [Salix koriyanagi]|uniref:Uncharacterized protein n=1 Tax=Salix koriyanagi TaxID=2511006 RepID=A0A9Q0VQD9_9ROSI|nr:hypothetical protein OIU74_027879 [Salix koriyanagi]